jgi:hypothetical protein
MEVSFRKVFAILKPKRRWFQFSLRTLFLLTAAVALLLGVGSRPLEQWWHVRSLQQLGVGIGGPVTFRYVPWDPLGPAVDPVEALAAPDPSAPGLYADFESLESTGFSWERLAAGDASFRAVELVSVCDIPEFGDDWMPRLARLGRLRSVLLCGTGVTDAGLVHLQDLGQLECLNLQGSKVSDAGLEHLKKLTTLRFLYLDRTAVTDAGLVHLHGLADLRCVSVTETGISDRGVEQLEQALPNCDVDR